MSVDVTELVRCASCTSHLPLHAQNASGPERLAASCREREIERVCETEGASAPGRKRVSILQGREFLRHVTTSVLLQIFFEMGLRQFRGTASILSNEDGPTCLPFAIWWISSQPGVDSRYFGAAAEQSRNNLKVLTCFTSNPGPNSGSDYLIAEQRKNNLEVVTCFT